LTCRVIMLPSLSQLAAQRTNVPQRLFRAQGDD
jgi:hypothetical protein